MTDEANGRTIHFYDWEACETLCGIDGPSPDEIIEDERDVEVTCERCLAMLSKPAASRRLTTETIKGSPEYTVTDADGAEVARAHCVNVPANLFTLVVGGKWAGVGPEAGIVAKLTALADS